MLNIMVVVAMAMPVSAWAAGTDSQPKMVLALADSGHILDSLPQKASVELKKSVAEATNVSPNLKSYLNSDNQDESPQYADLYTSPGGLVCVNPFVHSGAKGLEAKVQW